MPVGVKTGNKRLKTEQNSARWFFNINTRSFSKRKTDFIYSLSPVCIPCDTQRRWPAHSSPAPPSCPTSWILLDTNQAPHNQPCKWWRWKPVLIELIPAIINKLFSLSPLILISKKERVTWKCLSLLWVNFPNKYFTKIVTSPAERKTQPTTDGLRRWVL